MRPGVGMVSNLLEGNGIWPVSVVSCAMSKDEQKRRKIFRRILKIASRDFLSPCGAFFQND
jgi:hypothetical protein